MPLWGKTDKNENKPTFLKLKDDGKTLKQDDSNKQLVLIDNEEASLPENKLKGVTGPGWYLLQTNESQTRTRAELVVALADAPREDAGIVFDDSDESEEDAGLENP